MYSRGMLGSCREKMFFNAISLLRRSVRMFMHLQLPWQPLPTTGQ